MWIPVSYEYKAKYNYCIQNFVCFVVISWIDYGGLVPCENGDFLLVMVV